MALRGPNPRDIHIVRAQGLTNIVIQFPERFNIYMFLYKGLGAVYGFGFPATVQVLVICGLRLRGRKVQIKGLRCVVVAE